MPLPMMSEYGCDNHFLVDNQEKDVVVDSLTSGRLNGMTGLNSEQPAIPIEVPIKNQGKQQHQPKSKMHDGTRPHEVFVELHELDRSKMQWEEKARWIKYEQNAEGGTDRWGRPHIAHLSFKHVIELKKKLQKGSLLLDIEETDPSQIFHCIVDDLVKSGQIPDSSKSKVLKVLLYEHRHVGEGQGILRGMSSRVRRNTLSRVSRRRLTNPMSQGLSGIRGKQRQDLFASPTSYGLPTQETGNGDSTDVTVHFSNGASGDIRMPILNDISNGNGAANDDNRIQRRCMTNQLDDAELEDVTRRGIPLDAEATTIFIGQLNCLDKPVVSLVRLRESSPMSAMTEAPIPVRFMFLLLGPVGGKMDYYEIGRSFGTLMSSENFSEALYQTDNMKNIISAMNDFIDDTVVLPAGNWDKDLLLPVLRIQNEKVRERKLRQEIVKKWGGKSPAKNDAIPMQKASGNKANEIDPLKRTGRPFGGVINDIKRRYPHYLSDFKDALNGQCLAAVIFIFFAALSPAITFGGLLGEKTDNWMGISEMIVGSAVCGVIFALFSGQPLSIIGVTGPILVFEENLYKFCVSSEIEYLPFRFWVGAWMFLIAFLCVAVEGSVLVRFFTRFTEEIFAFLISIIFIYEVFNKLYQIFLAHPLLELEGYCNETLTDAYEVNVSSYFAHMNGTILGPITESMAARTKMATTNSPTTTSTFMMSTMFNESFGNGSDATVCGAKEAYVSNHPNTALLSTLLLIGTFLLANAFKIFKTSHYLGKTARKLICDFGIPIAIIIMVGKDLLISHVYTQKLDVPNGLVPTDGCKRGWFVNPMGMAKSMHIMWMFAAAIPAVLAFILMFMETLITALIVNKKDNKLKKGSGFHLDMFILGGLAAFNGLFGLPWVWAATVRSVTHTGALTVYSKSLAPGEKPKLEMIREQRVTALLVNVLIGMSILLAPLLKQVPLAVLFGVFLYMGVSSLNGIQFADRVFMLAVPVKHHPDEKYVRGVRTWRMHLFTVIQLCCVAILWVVKISPAALAFPFFLIILVPIRGQLKRIFSKEELEALDCAEAGNNEDNEDDD